MEIPSVRILIYTIVLYVWFALAPNTAIALIGVAGYALMLWSIRSDLLFVSAILYVSCIPLSVGKFFPLDLVSAGDLHLLGRPFGISADVTVSVRRVLAAGMWILLVWNQVRHKKGLLPGDALGWGLLVVPIAMMIASLSGSLMPRISVVHAVFYWEPYVIYSFFRSTSGTVRYLELLAAMCAVALWESALVISQHISGHTLGLVIENFPGYVPIDLSTDAGGAIRLGGTYPHANAAAQYLLGVVFALLPMMWSTVKGMRIAAGVAVSLVAFALIVALSRSSWFAGVIGLAVFWWVRTGRHRMAPDVRAVMYAAFPIGAALLVSVAIPRSAQMKMTFRQYGSADTRIALIKEAVSSIRAHPLFGVGLSMDAYYFYRQSIMQHVPLVSYFPEPVQNGFLQILMTAGFAGFLPYMIVIVMLLRAFWSTAMRSRGLRRWYVAGICGAFLAEIVNAQFQPLRPDLGQYVVLLAVLMRPESFSAAST